MVIYAIEFPEFLRIVVDVIFFSATCAIHIIEEIRSQSRFLTLRLRVYVRILSARGMRQYYTDNVVEIANCGCSRARVLLWSVVP